MRFVIGLFAPSENSRSITLPRCKELMSTIFRRGIIVSEGTLADVFLDLSQYINSHPLRHNRSNESSVDSSLSTMSSSQNLMDFDLESSGHHDMVGEDSENELFPIKLAYNYFTRRHKTLLWPVQVMQKQLRMKFMGESVWQHMQQSNITPPALRVTGEETIFEYVKTIYDIYDQSMGREYGTRPKRTPSMWVDTSAVQQQYPGDIVKAEDTRSASCSSAANETMQPSTSSADNLRDGTPTDVNGEQTSDSTTPTLVVDTATYPQTSRSRSPKASRAASRLLRMMSSFNEQEGGLKIVSSTLMRQHLVNQVDDKFVKVKTSKRLASRLGHVQSSPPRRGPVRSWCDPDMSLLRDEQQTPHRETEDCIDGEVEDDSGETLRVMVVEDSKSQRKLMLYRMRCIPGAENWVVRAAINGEEALSLVNSSDEPFDVVIVDENMQSSGGSLLGHEIVDILRKRPDMSQSVIIGCTSNAVRYANNFLAAGADAVWAKPMPDQDTIMSEVSSIRAARRNSL